MSEVPEEVLDRTRARYATERSKRTGVDRRYVRLSNISWSAAREKRQINRAPRTDPVDVTVIGAGIGGLVLGALLRETGVVSRIRLVDTASEVGGTWALNDFPGLECDVESYIYLPLLERTRTVPERKYVSGDTILGHCRNLAETFDLYRDTLLSTLVTSARWSPAEQAWHIETDVGDRYTSRFVCSAIGSLSIPKMPDIAGLDSFAGHSFHANRWDYAYTGGTMRGGLERLADKTVAVIGTGATAVQVIPEVAAAASRLLVIQRTPAVVLPKPNPATDRRWYDTLHAGWQEERRDNFHRITSGLPVHQDLVADGWTTVAAPLAASLLRAGSSSDRTPAEILDLQTMERIRSHIDRVVHDPVTAEALKPYYRLFCKRPAFHNSYYETFNRSNTELIDTRGRGVERIDVRGPVVAGTVYPVDCIIYATGFESEFATPYVARAGVEFIGRDGVRLSDRWADGVRTFHGVVSHGFPNLFFMAKAQSGLHVNVPLMLEEVAKHIAFMIGQAVTDGSTVEPTERAEDDWVREITSLAPRDVEFVRTCTPGLFNNEGEPERLPRQNSSYGKGSVAFLEVLENWRAAGELSDIGIRGAGLSRTAELEGNGRR